MSKRIIIIFFIFIIIIICRFTYFTIGNQYCIAESRNDYIDEKTQTLGNHYAYSECGSCIYVKNLENGKLYPIARNKGFLNGYREPFFSGEYIYYFDCWDGMISNRIFRSSINNDRINEEIVMDWVQYPVTVGNNILYFREDGKIKSKDLETKEEKAVFDISYIDESSRLSLFKYVKDDLYLAYENELVHIDLSNQKSEVLCSMKDKDEYFIDLALLGNENFVFLTSKGLYSYDTTNGTKELLSICIDEIETVYFSEKKLYLKDEQIYFNDNKHNLHCYDVKSKKDEIIYKLRGREDIVSAEYHFCDDYIVAEWYQYNTYENVERKEMKFKYN